jgi:micrococcal nuclease
MTFVNNHPWYTAAALLLAWLFAWLWHRRWRTMRLLTIIDGDTYVATDVKGVRRRLRLKDIDAPELGQRTSQESKAFVQQLTADKWVKVSLRGRDRYNRHLCKVRVEKRDLAFQLVLAGMAYPLSGAWGLRAAAAFAWLARRGVHRDFGQSRPWQAIGRNNRLVGWVRYQMRKKR